MLDRKKVVKAIENCIATQKCKDCPWEECEHETPMVELPKGLMENTLELLKEQEKVDVIYRQYDGSVESECGNCGWILDKMYSNCPKCGRKVNWDAPD